MKLKSVIFNVLAAFIPVIVFNLIQLKVQGDNLVILVISSLVAFVVLLLLTVAIEAISNCLDRTTYSGQWVLEFTRMGTSQLAYLGIGKIQNDKKTDECIFWGKLFDLNAIELLPWNVNALRLNRDNSTERVCVTQSDSMPIAIAQLTFTNKDECDGTIWTLTDLQYKINGYRIHNSMIKGDTNRNNIISADGNNHHPVISQEKYSLFIKEYIYYRDQQKNSSSR